MKRVRNLIIGAGPSGLSLAHRLNQAEEYDTLILEASVVPGGLCKSFASHEGSVFDIGGHSFHTPYHRVKTFVEELMSWKDGMFWQKRDARVYFKGDIIPYPFQQNSHLLTNQMYRDWCAEEFTPSTEKAANFEEHILGKFNDGVAKCFMLPYNKKLWKRDLSTMSADWAEQRVAGSKPESFEDAEHRIALQSSTMVGYPLKHPFEEIFGTLADNLPSETILYNATVVWVDLKGKNLIYNRYGHAEMIEYERLFVTMPLNDFMEITTSGSLETDHMARRLEYLSLDISFMTLQRYNDDVPQRLYVSGDETFAHKIAFNNLSSEWWSKSLHVSLMAEASSLPTDVHRDPSEDAFNFLVKAGLVDEFSLVDNTAARIKYGYPVYTLERPKIVADLKEYLSQFKVYTLGRFGSWRYVNSDACIEEAFQLADTL